MSLKATIGVPTFAQLGLMSELCKSLSKLSVTQPTAIQSQVIPSILKQQYHHFFAAQTGTGKTYSYLLPTFHILKQEEIREGKPRTLPFYPRAIVVVPNRELSQQCEYVMKEFKHDVRFRTLPVYSGQKMSVEQKELEAGVDILVGTPDRIDKLRREGSLFIDKATHFVVDECDTLIDAGYIKHIENYTQTIIDGKTGRLTYVAATFPKQLEKLLETHFTAHEATAQLKPYLKRIIEAKTHMNLSNLKHEFIELTEFDKNPIFLKLLRENSAEIKRGACLVFCNSIQSARATEHVLNENGFRALSLHGDIPPKKRNLNLEKFRNKEIDFLVCTDLGSRGLDFPHVNYVIQYDFPKTVSDYIHRAGRTGRAGREGTVMSLYRKSDMTIIKEMENSYKMNKPLRITSSAFS